jgi:hypothetical protein
MDATKLLNPYQSEVVVLRIVKILVLSSLVAIVALADVPKVGERAPQFSLPSTKGTSVALKDFIGKTKLVLVFYRGYW